jgi:hypothetical protein
MFVDVIALKVSAAFFAQADTIDSRRNCMKAGTM